MIQVRLIRLDRGVDWFEDGSRDLGVSSLILVSYGRVVYWIEQEKVILEKGDTLFIPAGMTYYAKCVPTVFHEKYVFEFSGSEYLPGLPLLTGGQWTKSRLGMFELCLGRIKTVYADWSDQAKYAETRALGTMLEWLALWSRELEERKFSKEIYQHAERMKNYIHSHYQTKITKEELGDHIYKSPNYAAALFKRITGQTISEYVHATRIKKATYLLLESNLSVGEIAEFVGYGDVSYFQRLFKKETGMTATEFMKS
ncbi:AraC family transcriptional regulator [Paenibacillus sp. NPDC058071]|uniref:helix-turn-helix transcriptional regulator n=1 Tax=Paenibacillus sp. NPDC058071 TaxID=3346326 RepID=UPI0036DCEC95